jgi:glycosyltransferase involved in cell wall biosynthesis
MLTEMPSSYSRDDLAVSVVVPCYKVTEYVTDTLDSLRRQVFRNFETIVVNDGCPDTANLERALLPYAGEIRYIKHEKNKGLAGARNTAIRAARAPLIALLDSDDAWEPGYLAEQVGFLEAHPEIDVVSPDAVVFGDSTTAGRLFTDYMPGHGDVTFHNIVLGKCFVFVGVTAKKECMMRVGLFDEDLRSAEDLDIWLRMLHAGARFAHNPKPLVRYRLRGGSLGDDRIALGRFALRVYGKLLSTLELTEEERYDVIGAIQRIGAMIDLIAAKRALYEGDRSQALQRFVRANKVLKSSRLFIAILVLRVWPVLLYRYVHYRFPTEHAYLH